MIFSTEICVYVLLGCVEFILFCYSMDKNGTKTFVNLNILMFGYPIYLIALTLQKISTGIVEMYDKIDKEG